MALFKISKGNSTNLPALSNSDDGFSWFTYDDGKFYIDYKENENSELKRKALNADQADTAEKVKHSLTIGSYSFDGSNDVTIPIYDGATS